MNYNKIDIKKMDTEDILEYLSTHEGSLTIEVKQDLLSQSLNYGKISIIKYLMDEGVTCDNTFSYKGLMRKKTSVKILSYLESKGVDLSMGNNVLLLDCMCHKNYPFFEYLFNKINFDESKEKLVRIMMINLIGVHEFGNHDESVAYYKKFLPLIKDDDFKTILPQFFMGTDKQITNRLSILKRLSPYFEASQFQMTLDILGSKLEELKNSNDLSRNKTRFESYSLLFSDLLDQSLSIKQTQTKKNKI